jgi:hypothetical protein
MFKKPSRQNTLWRIKMVKIIDVAGGVGAGALVYLLTRKFLNPSESFSETKSVFLPGAIPKADIIFAFDVTGSMSETINVAKVEAVNIMNALGSLVSDAQYGVMSFSDYPNTYDSYGYSDTYGTSQDHAYRLCIPLNSDKILVSDAVNALVTLDGADGPENYTRVMYESYADINIGWRDGARKIIIIFGDSVPHDDDLNVGVPDATGVYSTGGDPGRDEIMFTPDDLDLQTVLAEMVANNVTLLFIGPNGLGANWKYWTSITGGNSYDILDSSEVPIAIQTLVSELARYINKLTLKPQAGYENWMSTIPSEYTNFSVPPEGTAKTFEITLKVPVGTAPGTYSFNLIAQADGAIYSEQEVTVVVPAVPESGGNLFLAIVAGIGAYMLIKKYS